MRVSRSAVRIWRLTKLLPSNTSLGSSVSIDAGPNVAFHHEQIRKLSSTKSDEPKAEDKDLLDWRNTITAVIEDSQFEREMDDFLLSKVMDEGTEHNRLTHKGLSADPVHKTVPNNEDAPEGPKQVHSKTDSSTLPTWQFSNTLGPDRSTITPSITKTTRGGDDLLAAIARETRRNILRLQKPGDSQPAGGDAQNLDFLFGPLTKSPIYSPGNLSLKDDDKYLMEPTKAEGTDRGLPSEISGGFRVNVYRNITGSTKVLLKTICKQFAESVSQRVRAATDSPHLPFMQQFLDKIHSEKTDAPNEDVRFQMNQVCAALFEKLPKLSPDELALVCLVFGDLGYTNSLVLSYILAELQKPQKLSLMKLDAIAGTVLSLGMLQSTDSEFFGNVLAEFRHRFHERNTVALPPYAFASLLLGCCHLKEANMAGRQCTVLLEMLCEDPSAVSWNDLAVAIYVMAQLKLVQPGVLTILHSRLAVEENLQDLGCSACAVLLLGLEKILHLVHQRLHHSMCKDIYASLEDRVVQLISDDQIELTSIPDLVRSLSFPEMERMECYPILGKLLLKDDVIPPELPLWTLVFRLMSGYSNLMYRDPVMLKALNRRFHQATWSKVTGSTVAQLLHVGYRLRGLEETLVNRLVELISTNAFWDHLYRAKDAARIAYSLAGFEKLTPQIFEHCWKRCAGTPFSQYRRMSPQECVDTMFIAQGLFDGYQYIRHRFSASEARKRISLQGHKDLYSVIQTKNLAESGPQTASQKAVAEYLKEMGVELTHPALLEGCLHRADVALHDTKAVVLVPGMKAYYTIQPHEMNGALLIKKRSLEALKITVVVIREKEWLDTPDDEKESFLKQQFAMEGIDLDKLCHKEPPAHVRRASKLDESGFSSLTTRGTPSSIFAEIRGWLDERSIVLNRLLKSDLKNLLQKRSSLLEEEQQETFSQLAETALVENKLFVPRDLGKRRTLATKRKGDLIKDILIIEAEKLFGDRRPPLQNQGQLKMALHGS